MKIFTNKYFLGGLAAVLLLPLFSGCATVKPINYTVEVSPKTDASVQVDLIGAAESDLSDWRNYSIDKYLQPGDMQRKNADKFTLKLSGRKVEKLSATDPIWKSWLNRGSKYLVIIANLPGQIEAGTADPRRKIISLDKKVWDTKTKTLQIEIQDTRIVILTPEKL